MTTLAKLYHLPLPRRTDPPPITRVNLEHVTTAAHEGAVSFCVGGMNEAVEVRVSVEEMRAHIEELADCADMAEHLAREGAGG